MCSGKAKPSVDVSKLLDLEVFGYLLTDKLGGGSFGNVYRGSKSDGSVAAVKFLVDKNDAKIEVDMLKAVEGVENVQQLIFSGEFKDVHVIVINLLFMPLKRLAKRNVPGKEFGCFQKETLQRLLYQCIDVLEEIHKRNILHRDLKSNNILTTYPKGENNVVRVCIIDFGLSTEFGPTKSAYVRTGSMAHSSAHIMDDFEESRPIDDVIQISYMALELSNGQFDVDLSSEKLRDFKLALIKTPGIALKDPVAWLLPFFDTIASQDKASSVDYGQLKKSLQECIHGSDPAEELRMILVDNKWRLP